MKKDSLQSTQPDWFDHIPKVELHLHLEGAIPLPTLWELVQKYGGDAAVPDLESLNRMFTYRDFPHFIETWIWKRVSAQLWRFQLYRRGVARSLVPRTFATWKLLFAIRLCPSWTETRVDPSHHAGFHVFRGSIALVADLVRDSTPEQAAITLAEVNEVRELGVIGIGIGGSGEIPAGAIQRSVCSRPANSASIPALPCRRGPGHQYLGRYP
jgi:hypothetical protein